MSERLPLEELLEVINDAFEEVVTASKIMQVRF